MTREPARARWLRRRRTALDVLQFALFLGLLAWLVVQGANNMG